MWSKAQKRVIHRYARATGLTDAQYRAILYQATGFGSAADRRMDQAGFDTAMSCIEQCLEYRIEEGFVERPGWLRDLEHWRKRKPRFGRNMSTRQRHQITELWTELTSFLPKENWHLRHPEDDPFWYLNQIASRASGSHVTDIMNATARVGCVTINALKERILQEQRRVAHEMAEETD